MPSPPRGPRGGALAFQHRGQEILTVLLLSSKFIVGSLLALSLVLTLGSLDADAQVKPFRIVEQGFP